MTTEPIFKQYIGDVVRVYLPHGSFVGILESTTHDLIVLRPSLVGMGTMLEERAEIYNGSKTILTNLITTVEPIPNGIRYMERIVNHLAEATRRQEFLRTKDLTEKGYFGQQSSRQLELF